MKRWHASIHYLVFFENPLESTATTTAGPGIPARAARPTSPASSPPSGGAGDGREHVTDKAVRGAGRRCFRHAPLRW